MAAGALWYQLAAGRFQPIASPEQAVSRAPLPWTVQERVAALVQDQDSLYLGLNGYGVAILPAAGTSFRYVEQPLLFAHRTITTLAPTAGGIICHLYFNEILNTIDRADLPTTGISLLLLGRGASAFQRITPPFQRSNPDWEAVAFVAAGEERFYLEWKRSEEERTLFRYALYRADRDEDREIQRQDYRRAFGFRDLGSDLSAETRPLRALLARIRARLDRPGSLTAYQLLLRRSGEATLARYEFHPDGFATSEKVRLFALPVVQEGRALLLLGPDGLLLRAEGARVRAVRLPHLPPGFVYTDLAVQGGRLLVAWEQSRFTQVQAAGAALLPAPF